MRWAIKMVENKHVRPQLFNSCCFRFFPRGSRAVNLHVPEVGVPVASKVFHHPRVSDPSFYLIMHDPSSFATLMTGIKSLSPSILDQMILETARVAAGTDSDAWLGSGYN